MNLAIDLKKIDIRLIGSIVIPLLLFGIVLSLKLPHVYTRVIGNYSFIFFLLVFVAYYGIYRLPGRWKIFVGFGGTLLLCSLTLSYRWSSGFSDNFMMGGLLPYKDAKNYYVGANLILNGLPLEGAGQGTERPLFPGFLSSVLFGTGQNLQVSLAILTLLAGAGLYFSSLRIANSFGPTSASLYSTFLFFYIHSWLGYTMSELYGFIMGCFAFALMWHVARDFRWFDLILGVLTLLIAVSARAGAFLVFPLLILWVGWIFRGEKRYAIKARVYALLVTVAGYFALNSLYGKLLGVPAGSTFSNFAYAMYGQVRGGTGWHSAIEELGTRNPSLVYQAALQFFLAHPISLFIAIAKSYRDFFFPGYPNILPFDFYGQPAWLTYLLWVAFMALLIRGTILLVKSMRWNVSSLLIAAFAGILFSVPFLPPIDGGSRFHASTMPFLYVIPAVGASRLIKRDQATSSKIMEIEGLRFTSILLILLTVIAPIFISSLNAKPSAEAIACPPNQAAFTIQVNPSSFIDLVQDGGASCGFAPEICLSDFEAYNTEMQYDDFYQFTSSVAQQNNLRVIPAINWNGDQFRYFFVRSSLNLGNGSQNLLSGCATEVVTKSQKIYLVESVVPND